MGDRTHRWVVAAAVLASALAVGAVVVQLAREGNSGALTLLAVMPGVLVAAFSGRRTAGGCHLPWSRRRDR